MHAKKTIKNYKEFFKDIYMLYLKAKHINIKIKKRNPFKKYFYSIKRTDMFSQTVREIGVGFWVIYIY